MDLLTLPSHTSHALQPLDVTIFKPFKISFSLYRDVWTMSNKGSAAHKETLAQWVSLSLRKALLVTNIQRGFATTGIWPINASAMEGKMGPSKDFMEAHDGGVVADDDDDEENDTGEDNPDIAQLQLELEGLVVHEMGKEVGFEDSIVLKTNLTLKQHQLNAIILLLNLKKMRKVPDW